jgi:predicted regulator of Ras-like GTPase activity (Roadblock/LC7/MglB family)
LPEEFRGFFDESAADGIVVLPLHEVLKNLPAASLQMRDDQEEQEKSVPAPEEEIAAAPSAELKLEEPTESNAEFAPELETAVMSGEAAAASETGTRTVLQTALDTDDELDAKSVVTHVGRMEGVQACAIMFADGLSLAGNLPESYGAEGLCAMAPSLLERAENHMTETKLGQLRAMTLSCSNAAVTFLRHDNLCLAALHEKELTSEIRERLARTVQELSLKYSHPV